MSMLATSWWHLSLSDLLVGGGTLALAWFTWRLARQTRKSVDAATNSLGIAKDSLKAEQDSVAALDASVAAAQRPVLVPVETGTIQIAGRQMFLDHGPTAQPDGSLTLVALRNVGSGPALSVRGQVSLRARGDAGARFGRGIVRVPRVAVAVAQTEALPFDRDEGRLNFSGTDMREEVTFEILYDDVSGKTYGTTARYHSGERLWYVTVAPDPT